MFPLLSGDAGYEAVPLLCSDSRAGIQQAFDGICIADSIPGLRCSEKRIWRESTLQSPTQRATRSRLCCFTLGHRRYKQVSKITPAFNPSEVFSSFSPPKVGQATYKEIPSAPLKLKPRRPCPVFSLRFTPIQLTKRWKGSVSLLRKGAVSKLCIFFLLNLSSGTSALLPFGEQTRAAAQRATKRILLQLLEQRAEPKEVPKKPNEDPRGCK